MAPGSGLVSRRRTNEEDRNRTYKPALDSCPVLIARHREGGGFLHPLSPSLSFSLALPRRFRDSWQRVPRAFGSIDSKRAHERVEIFRITTSPSWNGFEGRLLITCICSNVEQSLGKLLDYFETIRRKAVCITIIERMLVLIRSAVRIVVLSRVYYVSCRKRNKVLNRV